ncbi:hypothetical protein PLICRDRAFT_698920 [Plicaturopsis crispa FD-325 SS-3]|nr:hypothetical protein PLICRDRAFT_698920 [Plicaturopsis crispa FD-325 SS-3]
MSAGLSLTQKWLRQNVNSYPEKDRVFADIDAALGRYPTLRPKSDVYIYDDGRTQLLLCVHGLLPITYRRASYNIPIAIWITREYPRQPPIAYVVPTNDMLVKAGKYVEVSGRCVVEYIQHWERKSESCHIAALLEALQDQFSKEPPVYARPKPNDNNTPSPVHATPDYSGRPPPPLPPSHTPPTQANTTHLARDDRPPLPPKPGSAVSPPARPSSLHSVVGPPTSPRNPNSSSLPLNAPVEHGPPQYGPHPVYNMSRQTSLTGPPQPLPHAGPSSNRWSVNSPPPAPIYRQSPPPPPFAQHAYHRPDDVYQPLSQPPYAQPQPPPQPWSPPQGPPPENHHIPPPDLLDEEDSLDAQPASSQNHSAAAPPRPPNPELLRLHAQVHAKLTSELASTSQALALDAERLRAHQTDLLAGEPAIRDEMARLEAVRDVCRNVVGRMRDTVDQAERNVAELRRKGDPEVDELVCSTSIVHNQLVNLVAEDNAIEDTIYHLHRALNTGRIDLERFLRTTRVLAEEQFMKRALIEKIHAGMPMGMSDRPGWS